MVTNNGTIVLIIYAIMINRIGGGWGYESVIFNYTSLRIETFRIPINTFSQRHNINMHMYNTIKR